MKKIWVFALAALAGLASCSKGMIDYDGGYAESVYKKDGMDGMGGRDRQGRPGGESGVLTAGEWNDLDHWDFWSGLMESETYSSMSGYWRFYTARRVAVRVADREGARLPNLPVSLVRGEEVLWTTRTDAAGEASLWVDPFHASASTEDLSVLIDGVRQEAAPKLTPWNVQKAGPEMNFYQVGTASPAEAKADIAFIVDATGSMGDEISFLKEDLKNILERVKGGQGGIALRTGTVFYRDEGDDYVTRHSAFTDDFQSTVSFVGWQQASGGGDLPEAVHTALEAGLQDLSWNMGARARIAFLILDAPAHQDHQGVVECLQKSVRTYAEMGIRLIPVFCSSPSKECEFMCRFFSVLTGGTYVFLTDDSGVGGDHIEASVGEFQVEPLNDLLVRLIAKYIG